MKASEHEHRLELEIYGLSFRLRAPVDERPRLERAAKHVDNVMRELIVSQSSSDTARLAMQAALVITVEYFKAMDELAKRDGATDDVLQRIDDLLGKLDESLKSVES